MPPKRVRKGTTTESKGTEESRQQLQTHPHIHEVKYVDKSGNTRDYRYDYGKVGTKSKTLRIIKKR